ncbi:hypothetical protein ABH917_002929 [Thermobifida halotolerans]
MFSLRSDGRLRDGHRPCGEEGAADRPRAFHTNPCGGIPPVAGCRSRSTRGRPPRTRGVECLVFLRLLRKEPAPAAEPNTQTSVSGDPHVRRVLGNGQAVQLLESREQVLARDGREGQRFRSHPRKDDPEGPIAVREAVLAARERECVRGFSESRRGFVNGGGPPRRSRPPRGPRPPTAAARDRGGPAAPALRWPRPRRAVRWCGVSRRRGTPRSTRPARTAPAAKATRATAGRHAEKQHVAGEDPVQPEEADRVDDPDGEGEREQQSGKPVRGRGRLTGHAPPLPPAGRKQTPEKPFCVLVSFAAAALPLPTEPPSALTSGQRERQRSADGRELRSAARVSRCGSTPRTRSFRRRRHRSGW